MKLRSTTPASITLPGKIVLATLAIVAVISAPIQIMTRTVSADEYDDKINALQKEISQFKTESDRLNGEATTLQNALAKIGNEKTAIQTQINLSQARYDKLVASITETKKKISDNQDGLGKTIADLYVDDKISPIEMIASSSTIGEFMDKQEYRNSVRDELTTTIAEINELKASLDKQKEEAETVLSNQKAQRDALVAKENEQQALIDKTKGEESSYRALMANSMAKQAEVRAQQQTYLASLYNGGGSATLISGSVAPGYPWNKTNCQMGGELHKTGNYVYYSYGGSDGNGKDGGADGVGSDGYGCRQCASYVAWRVGRETGKYPNNWGDATDFPANASAWYGIGYTPRAGSIGVIKGTRNAPEGHVVWVESVNNDGTLTVSQYNYNNDYPSPLGWGQYSMMKVPANSYNVFIYIK